MGWMKPYRGKWSAKNVDKDALEVQLGILYECAKPHHSVDSTARLVVFYVQQLRRDIELNSMLVDMGYGLLFDYVQGMHSYESYDKMMEAMTKIYKIADIATAAEDTIKRRARERKWMVREGYANA